MIVFIVIFIKDKDIIIYMYLLCLLDNDNGIFDDVEDIKDVY